MALPPTRSGNVYVADTGNNRIQKFAWQASTCPVLDTISLTWAMGRDERIYAIQGAPATVRSYTPSGTLIENFGSAGAGNGQFSGPQSLAVTPSGRVAVSDTGNRRVELLNFTNSRTLYDSKSPTMEAMS